MSVVCSAPRLGKYTQLFTEIAGLLGWEAILPPEPSIASIERGASCLNELMCLPAKVTLGTMIQACESGVNKLVMFDSCGDCRLKSYWILQQRALKKLGYSATVYPIRLGRYTPGDMRSIDPSLPYWKAWKVFFLSLRRILEVDKKLWPVLPEDTELPKIGIVGEIFTILERVINMRLFEKLERMGALVHNSLPLSYFVLKGLYNRGWIKRPGISREEFLIAAKEADRYFPKESIGGHGKESIIHTIYYGMMKFDGVIHVMPFPCSPEAVVAPILDDIGRDYGIPVMRLIFDTHTGEGGVDTRLEAFVDVLKRRRARRLYVGKPGGIRK